MLDYSQQAYDAHDRYGTHALYTQFGLDGMKYTADDGIGPDGMWFTADDIPNYVNTATYDSTAMTAAGTSYSGPGPDHVWMTGDDIVSSSFTSTYDAHWVHTGNTYLTASNIVSGYTTYHHDSDGLLMDDTDYTSSGPDSVWHTADDRPGYRYDFDDTH